MIPVPARGARAYADTAMGRPSSRDALAGAALVLAADIAVRLGPSAVEIKLGVVTALIGVPIFLSMIFRERRLLEEGAS